MEAVKASGMLQKVETAQDRLKVAKGADYPGKGADLAAIESAFGKYSR